MLGDILKIVGLLNDGDISYDEVQFSQRLIKRLVDVKKYNKELEYLQILIPYFLFIKM